MTRCPSICGNDLPTPTVPPLTYRSGLPTATAPSLPEETSR